MPVTRFHQPFRPRARVLQLLGDELIGNPRLAVFELVKNAYDADANEVKVEIDLTSSEKPVIRVSDDGEGMSPNTLRSTWLVPGDDHRRKQRNERVRSKKHHRLPLGEKGVGRFAVHKLGNKIRLVTRAENYDECIVEINWSELIANTYLDEAPVVVNVQPPSVFPDDITGTYIEIQELREPEWTRGEIRRLYSQIVSICSPFKEPGSFRAKLTVPGNDGWIEDLPDFRQIIDRAIWKFEFAFANGSFDWMYEFRQVPGFNLDGRQVSKKADKLQLPGKSFNDWREKKVVADESTSKGVGTVVGEFYVFDREREVLRRFGDSRLLTEYLDENGGIRVYRDGIRVYNYGERGDDWLGLDLRRVNIPTRRISRNIILGAVHLSLESSTDLIEKTNREGFVENDACDRLRRTVLGALGALEFERQIDKDRIRRITENARDPILSRIEKPIFELRGALREHEVADLFEPYVTKIERDYTEMQETLLAAGMSGLNLAVVFHEVERGVRALHQVILDGRDLKSANEQARELVRVLDGFTTLLRRDRKNRHSANRLAEAVRKFNILRFRHHDVRFSCPILNNESSDFNSTFSFGLALGALNNLVDNALYWLRVRWSDESSQSIKSKRRLFVGSSTEYEHGPAIVVADNGPGFQGDSPELLVRPFYTRKPDGMGLGLYYANLAMELNGGRLEFPDANDFEIPSEYDGAVVAMVFQGTK